MADSYLHHETMLNKSWGREANQSVKNNELKEQTKIK